MNKGLVIAALAIIVLILIGVGYIYYSGRAAGQSAQQLGAANNSTFTNSTFNGTAQNESLSSPLPTNSTQDQNYSVLSQSNIVPPP